MSRVFTSVLAITAVGLFSLGACSSDRRDFPNSQAPEFTGSDGGDAPEAGPECGFRCSRDLKKVLKGCGTEEGDVVADCPKGQGCGVDSCVDACTSAALSKGSAGCSFWTLPPDDDADSEGSCFAAMVAN